MRYRINYHHAAHVHKYTMRDSEPKDYIYIVLIQGHGQNCACIMSSHTQELRKPVMAETIWRFAGNSTVQGEHVTFALNLCLPATRTPLHNSCLPSFLCKWHIRTLLTLLKHCVGGDFFICSNIIYWWLILIFIKARVPS